MSATTRQDQRTVLQIIEEATSLLRSTPPSAWAWYFSGTLLFVCVLLHFWNDMSRGAGAENRLPSSSLLLALTYVFMKVCHAMFGDHLMRQLKGDNSPAPLPFRSKLRLITSQALVHASMPWILPLSLAAMLPFGWAYASFHNASILSVQILRDGGRTRDVVRSALAQSHFRQGQNHGVMIALLCFSVAVWMNLFFGLMLIAVLGSSFTGSTNAIALNPWILLGTSILAATICGTYVVCAPIVKAVYALRCFYSQSRKTGEDLLIGFKTASARAVCVIGLGFLATSGAPAIAQKPVSPQQLEESIQSVLQTDAFQWKLPREANKKEERGWIADFIDAIESMAVDTMRTVGRWLDRTIGDWLDRIFRGRQISLDGDMEDLGTGRASTIQTVLWTALAILGVALLVVLYRQWRKMPPAPAKAPIAVPEINLESDAVVATQLPELEWLRLAQEKAAIGDYRLAMRALFLATLAHLGERKLIAVSRWKSNGDYRRELRFRSRSASQVHEAFDQTVSMFDWAWYGWHEVTADLLERFSANHKTIINDGTAS
ncbi:MAG: DUF4129 domain-containing protein [Verrucomicrobiaceae bacterium]|nr:DUF4129 domain-containing protein [Verrucomicrobiaceae bacterium]